LSLVVSEFKILFLQSSFFKSLSSNEIVAERSIGHLIGNLDLYMWKNSDASYSSAVLLRSTNRQDDNGEGREKPPHRITTYAVVEKSLRLNRTPKVENATYVSARVKGYHFMSLFSLLRGLQVQDAFILKVEIKRIISRT